MIRIRKGEQEAAIDGGELVSYRVAGYEFIHQKGSPGWGHSDTEMFPVIGPTAEASYRVQVPRGNAIQDQHGLLRELDYRPVEQSPDRAVFIKRYKAGTPVKNSKYPERSKVQWLIWPYDFQLKKEVALAEASLEVQFTISGEKDMPFMFGYHPAFRLEGMHPLVLAGERSISLKEILAAGNRALLVEKQEEVCLQDKRSLKIKARGFGQFMLWTEVTNMVCIEPVSYYPYAAGQHELHQGFEYLGDKPRTFGVSLIPGLGPDRP